MKIKRRSGFLVFTPYVTLVSVPGLMSKRKAMLKAIGIANGTHVESRIVSQSVATERN